MADDIELDSESMQSDLGSGHAPVRKAISLKLKKPKAKPKAAKQTKAKTGKSPPKKEKRNADVKPAKVASVAAGDKLSQHNQRDLDWNQPIAFVGEKVQDPMIHICEKCTLPVLVYGRLNPCKHVFCLTCAEKARSQCPRCEAHVERIEPAGIGQIYVCSFGGSQHGISGCRRSYLSQRDLLAHIRHRHQRDGAPGLDSDLKPLEQKYQQTVPMPFLGSQFHSASRPPQGMSVPRQVPMDNYSMMPGMPMPDQMFHDGPRMLSGGQFRPMHPQVYPRPPMNPQQPHFRPDQPHIQGMSGPPPMQERYMPHSSAGGPFPGTPRMTTVGASPENSGGQFMGGGLRHGVMVGQNHIDTLQLGQAQRTGGPHSMVDARGHVDNMWHSANPMQGVVGPQDDWPQRGGRGDMQGRYPPHNEGPRFPQQFYK